MGNGIIVSIDLGTTGNRIYCFDESMNIITSAYSEFRQIFPKQAWVEHDPLEIWDSIKVIFSKIINSHKIDLKKIISIGITCQRETTVMWDRKTGMPVYNAIVWQCRRTTEICQDLKNRGLEDLFKQKTGLLLDPYFSGTKIKWILNNVEGVSERSIKGEICFGTIDSWIIFKLTNGQSHKTDYTNASRTLIFNIINKSWDDELLKILDIPKNILPEVQSSASYFGITSNAAPFPDGIKITGVAGDQQSAMVGQGCVKPGTIKNTYGTGCFLLENTGNDFVISKHGLLTTLVCDEKGKPVYALEGSVFIGGAVIQWLRDYMNFFRSAPESQNFAESLTQIDDEVVFVPAMTGLGAPYWNMDARGAIFGLTRDSTKEQITRAALKGIAFSTMDIIKSMENDSGKKIIELRVDGGATQNNFLMQFQADILNKKIILPEITETTALGAAYLSAISAGIYDSIDQISHLNRIKQRFSPKMNDITRNIEIKRWNDAIRKLIS